MVGELTTPKTLTPNILLCLTSPPHTLSTAPINFPSFTVPQPEEALELESLSEDYLPVDASLAPKLAMSFGTAGLWFYFGTYGCPPDSGKSFGKADLTCDEDTYGSIAFNTAVGDVWMCVYFEGWVRVGESAARM